jgi:hypothetical protein
MEGTRHNTDVVHVKINTGILEDAEFGTRCGNQQRSLFTGGMKLDAGIGSLQVTATIIV